MAADESDRYGGEKVVCARFTVAPRTEDRRPIAEHTMAVQFSPGARGVRARSHPIPGQAGGDHARLVAGAAGVRLPVAGGPAVRRRPDGAAARVGQRSSRRSTRCTTSSRSGSTTSRCARTCRACCAAPTRSFAPARDVSASASARRTADGKFSLDEVECLASCGTAPMMQVNDDYRENLTAESTLELIDRLGRE